MYRSHFSIDSIVVLVYFRITELHGLYQFPTIFPCPQETNADSPSPAADTLTPARRASAGLP